MSALPTDVFRAVQRLSGRILKTSQSVFGGSINEAAALVMADGGRLFCKWHRQAPAHFFEAEADGLRRLGATGAIRVPRVIGYHDDPSDLSVLLLEHIETTGGKRREGMASLGRTLAALHGQRGQPAGLVRDNFIGSLPQENGTMENWVDFFVTRRLRPLGQGLPRDLRHRLFTIDFHAKLTEPEGGCAILHGDLWSGNVLTTAAGEGVFIDPAVYAGHPEVDVAMTRLFGGFTGHFYDAYQEVAGRFDDDIDMRLELYNLYPLLVHVNLFGGGYTNQVAATVERYL